MKKKKRILSFGHTNNTSFRYSHCQLGTKVSTLQPVAGHDEPDPINTPRHTKQYQPGHEIRLCLISLPVQPRLHVAYRSILFLGEASPPPSGCGHLPVAGRLGVIIFAMLASSPGVSPPGPQPAQEKPTAPPSLRNLDHHTGGRRRRVRSSPSPRSSRPAGWYPPQELTGRLRMARRPGTGPRCHPPPAQVQLA